MIYDEMVAEYGDVLGEHFPDSYWAAVDKASAEANWKSPGWNRRLGSTSSAA